MPGLVGIISRQQQPQDCDRQVLTMLASMQCKDFYSSGVYTNPDMSVYVGWSCHPKSFCDGLPVTNQTNDFALFLRERSWGMIRKFHREALIKAEYFASHGMPDWLATISQFGLREILERSFLGRNKFQHFRLWTQKRFAGYITDVLLQGSEDLEQFFNKRRIERMVREHLAGRQNYVDEIDKILTLTLAYRTLLKSNPFKHS
jgi:hypothetical protein